MARSELSVEAIRLTRMVAARLPDDPEVAGLLALMLLNEARRPARTGHDGELVPLAEQDRSRRDQELVGAGVALIWAALPQGKVGEHQLQAAIAAMHDEAPSAENTDWPQILALYGLLEQMTGNPMVKLNRAVAAAMVDGPAAGLRLLESPDEPLERLLSVVSPRPGCEAADVGTGKTRSSQGMAAHRSPGRHRAPGTVQSSASHTSMVSTTTSPTVRTYSGRSGSSTHVPSSGS